VSAFALNDSHDISIAGGQLARAIGPDFVVQSIKTQLGMYLGEWWLDFTAGTPWFQQILVSPADISNAEATLKSIILGTDGVLEIVEFAADFDAKTRSFRVSFVVLTEFGPSGGVVVSA